MEEEGQQNPVSFTFDHLQYALQEGEQKRLRLLMILDAWKDPSTFQDWLSFGSQEIWTETTLVGSLNTTIEGITVAEFNDHELVEFIRYEECPYDAHAIKVLNSSSGEVGYLYIPASKVLSPLVYHRKIILEGEVTCSKIRNDNSIPCVVRIFAKSADVLKVKDWLLEKRLRLCDQPGTSFGSSVGMGVKEGSRIEKLGTLEPPKNVIKAKLLDHQKEGLWWLVNKEKSDELPPFWEVKDGLYLNVLTRHQTNTRPKPLHGGIYADDYGLGKTLTLLSLIAFDKVGNVPEGTGEEDKGVSVFCGEGRGSASEKDTGEQKIHTLLDSNIKESSVGMAVHTSSSASVAKQTLIVCPSAVCSTWENQLQEHTQKGSLELYKYYGNSRTKDVEELKKYDIVLTTYSTLVADGCEHIQCPLMKIEWWRIILDEAHVIKNANAKQNQEFTKLTAWRRWAVTGAPIQNGTFDLFPLMAFFQLDPLSTERYWRELLQKPLVNGDEKGFSRLQVLLATISLRRIKDKVLVGLPSKTVSTVSFELSGEERRLYDQVEANSKNVVEYFIAADILHSRYTYVLFSVIQLRQLCNDSALCCLDLRSLLPSDNIADASKLPELPPKMIDALQDGQDFNCACCGYPTNDAVITKCVHIFCQRCFRFYMPGKFIKTGCPICGYTVSRFSAPAKSSNPENPKKPSRTTPSKVSALIKHLRKESRVVNSTSKSVVFSLFDKMLALMEEPLKDAGFNTLRLDASTDERRQAEIIKEFGSAGADMVLLASLKTSGTGINLTAASKVYLFEPWWNAAVEEQAINRVHQYGQEENVRIFRLIAKNSIEERIWKMMQERKKAANEAFGRQGPKEQEEASIDDLCSLLFFS